MEAQSTIDRIAEFSGMVWASGAFGIGAATEEAAASAGEAAAERAAKDAAQGMRLLDDPGSILEMKQLVAYMDGAKHSGRVWDDWKAAMTAGQTFDDAMKGDAMKGKPKESSPEDYFESEEKASLLKSLGLTEQKTA